MYLVFTGQVSVPLGQTRDESTGGAITSRSLDETSSWKAVGRFVQDGMMMRLTTAEGVEADGLVSKIHVAANEPVGPKGVHRKAMTQEADGTSLRTAADEDDRPDWMGLQIRSPGGREWPPRRRPRS